MSIRTLKQSLSATIMRHTWSRRLQMLLPCIYPLLRGKTWGSHQSWSEDTEDDVLLQAAGSLPLSGFYLDIGANLPMKRSNTYRLYCSGMRGICVEPNVELAALYEHIRPEDHLVCAAIAPNPGLTTLHRFNYHVFSTCSAEESESRVQRSNPNMRSELLRKSLVPALSISTLLNNKPDSLPDPFFLLKVDTEGFDLAVLQTNDWSKHRPRFVLTEATGQQQEVADFLSSHHYQLIETFPANQLFEKQEN